MTNLHNIASEDLVDELGALKADAADLKARIDAINEELIQRGDAVVEGALFRVTISPPSMRATLSSEKIRAEMPESWLARFLTFSNVKSIVRVSARSGVLRRAA